MKTIVWSATNIPASPETRRALRPIGRDVDSFHSMLQGYERLATWADELGFEAFGSAEHHFQAEGGETIPNVLLVSAMLAARTKQIMFVPLTMILPTHNPLRVAEDLAQFSHMHPGRIGVGFGRGYQTRWLQTMTQSEGIASMNPASDAVNREIFDEYLSIVERAWEEDSFEHRGKNFEVPFPADGIRDWPLAEWTRTYAGPGDVDAEGTIHRISVLPKPFAKLPVFVPNVASKQTVIDAGRNGRILLSIASLGDVAALTKLYRDSALEVGRDVEPGEGVGLVRKVVFGDTFEEAIELAGRTAGHWYNSILSPFGITEGLRTDADDPDRPVSLDDRALAQRMYEQGALLCGTPDQVRDQVAALHEAAGGRLDWLAWEFWQQALHGDDAVDIQRAQLEHYAQTVAPAFR